MAASCRLLRPPAPWQLSASLALMRAGSGRTARPEAAPGGLQCTVVHGCARLHEAACGAARLRRAAWGRVKPCKVARACATAGCRARACTRLHALVRRLQAQQEGFVLQQRKGGRSCQPAWIVTGSATIRDVGQHEGSTRTPPAPLWGPSITNPSVPPPRSHTPPPSNPPPIHLTLFLMRFGASLASSPSPALGGHVSPLRAHACEHRAERCQPPPCAHTRVCTDGTEKARANTRVCEHVYTQEHTCSCGCLQVRTCKQV